MKKLFCALALAALATNLQAHKRVERRSEKDFGKNLRMEFTVTYLDPLGHTVADAQGMHYYHDYVSAQWGITPPLATHEPKVLPSQYFGTYPLYYSNQTMHYQIKLTNTGKRALKRLTVVAIQEFLNATGQVGTRLGDDATRDWFVAKLKKGESTTLEGSINIPSVGESGLDQTHIQVLKSRKVKDEDRDDDDNGPDERQDDEERGEARLPSRHAKKADRVIFDDVQAGIWCPPASQPTKP